MGNDWFHEYFINELKAIGRKPTSNMQHEVVDSLPSSGNEQTIYFVKNDSSSSNNHYDEYVWISSSSTFEKIGSSQIDGSAANPDWNQNDATQPDYVKNRPFYTGNPVETVLVEESAVAFQAAEEMVGLYGANFPSTVSATVGKTYKVYWDSIVYECTCVNFNGTSVIGNLSILNVGADSGEPFLIGVVNGRGFSIYTADTASSHTISITEMITQVVKIDAKYMPEGYPKKRECNIEWDGNTEGLVSVLETLYKVSDLLPTDDELIGSTIELSNRKKQEITSDMLGATSEDITSIGKGDVLIAVVKKDNAIIEDTTFPQKGTYFAKQQDFNADQAKPLYVQKLTGAITPMAEEFMPLRIVEDIDNIGTIAHNAQSTATNAQSTANNAQSTATNAQTTANAAKTAADTAKTTADAAKTAATNAQTTANKALILDPKGYITAPIRYMNDGAYQSLSLCSKDQNHQVKFAVTESTGLQIFVTRDGGSGPSTISNPSTVEFISSGGTSMQLSGINALIMSPINSNKKFKITVDDSGTLSATEVT